MLIIFGGLPGSGKTTVARALARRLGAVHVRVDTIEQALRSCDVLKEDVGPAGYVIGYGVADDNLRLGRIVVADSVNPLRVTRDAWRAVADRASCKVAEVEVVCSDRGEHRRRIETRRSDIDGLELPTWQAVMAREYEPWDRPRLVADTAVEGVDQQVADLIVRLGFQI